jgi:mannose-1-phosphate guanylyltransferase
MNNNFCVIMAGGIGSRFWPLSKTSCPKQFLDILGTGKTLLRQTFERFLPLCPHENFYIVTNKIYKEIVLEQLPEIDESQVLCEPLRRNTAPCIMYANYVISKRNPNARIVVAPSDHLILKEQEFTRIISEGFDFVSNDDVLLTLGIQPSRPDTGYGYIQVNEKNNNPINKVKTFTEKPNLEMAKFFYESGDFFWNSGIFIWSLTSINKAFQEYLPEVYNLFNSENTCKTEEEFIDLTYSNSPNISIDYGIMEKANNVHVYKSEFGWSDLGTWGSLYENANKDTSNNALIGDAIIQYDTKDCMVNAPKDKLVVLQGLEDYIVIDSGESLLICKKEEEQKIRQFVNDIQSKYGDKYI